MKRYLLFAGPEYYASGGFHDFADSFATQLEARQAAESMSVDWWHVFDVETRKIVLWGEGHAYGVGAKPAMVKT
jgi:hypothetical protein